MTWTKAHVCYAFTANLPSFKKEKRKGEKRKRIIKASLNGTDKRIKAKPTEQRMTHIILSVSHRQRNYNTNCNLRAAACWLR